MNHECPLCQGELSPLQHIRLNVWSYGDTEKPSSHYSPYPYECVKCGMVWEMERAKNVQVDEGRGGDWPSYHVTYFPCYGRIGSRGLIAWDGWKPVYGAYIDNKEVEELEIQLSRQLDILRAAKWAIKDAIKRQIAEIEKPIGRLEKHQREHLEKSLLEEYKQEIETFEAQIGQLYQEHIPRIRRALGLELI